MGGDSATALRWAETRRAHSALTTNAAIFFALQGIATGLHISETGHIAAADNWRCDALSGGVSWEAFVISAPEWAHIAYMGWEVTVPRP
jgi:hypothetical protein